MCGDLCQNGCNLAFLEERAGVLEGLLDDLLGAFNCELGCVVLLLFLSPFLILEFLLGIEHIDFLVDCVKEIRFFVLLSDFLVTDWDFGLEFGG